jgi:hypothetical protein
MKTGLAIYAILAADSGVAAIVGTRIYPNFAPAGAALPNVVYEQVTATRTKALVGHQGLTRQRFTVRAIATTYTAAESLADAVRLALCDYVGTAGGIVVKGIFLDGERDVPDSSPEIDAGRMYGKEMDFFVHVIEAT